MDNKTKELDQNSTEIIFEYKTKGKLHPDFLPITTYDMVQSGYPTPNEGLMIARDWGGTNEKGLLLPSEGMWCKIEDVKKLLEQHDIDINAL